MNTLTSTYSLFLLTLPEKGTEGFIHCLGDTEFTVAVCVDFSVCCCGKEAVLAGISVLLLLCETGCDSYQVHSSGALDQDFII